MEVSTALGAPQSPIQQTEQSEIFVLEATSAHQEVLHHLPVLQVKVLRKVCAKKAGFAQRDRCLTEIQTISVLLAIFVLRAARSLNRVLLENTRTKLAEVYAKSALREGKAEACRDRLPSVVILGAKLYVVFCAVVP
ncbi:UNVERIFIED_CONTAM: hypothetical protein K2H54_015652 [Gekko kuhli]